MTGKKIRNTVVQLVSTAAIFLSIVSFFHLMRGCIALGNSIGFGTDSSQKMVPQEILAPACFICYALAFYSFSYAALSFDLLLKPSSFTGLSRFSARAKRTVSSPLFWGEVAVILLLLLVLPGAFLRISGYYRIAAYPAFAVLFFFAWTSVFRRWYEEDRRESVSQKERSKKTRVRDVLKAIGGRVVLYIIFSYMAPVLAALYYTLYKILGLISVPFLVFLLSIYPLILLIRYLRAISKRRKMLKKLKRICENKGYSLDTRRPYRSILFPHAEPEITIRTENETIECKLLCALSRGTPIFLTPDGEANVVHTVRFRGRTLFRHYVCTRYSFGEGDRKILLIVPIPRDVFRTGVGRPEPTFSGDRVGDSAVYRTTSFLDALEADDFD